MKSVKGAVAAGLLLLLAGCAGTIPVHYQPQNYVRYKGKASIGKFGYQPAQDGKVQPNQIQNTALGSIFIAVDVSKLAQRATALEMEKTGFDISDRNPLSVSGQVMEFKAADLGYHVTWDYAIRYTIKDKSTGKELFSEDFHADEIKTGKFGSPKDYGPSINEMILSAYNKFIKNDRVRGLLSTRSVRMKRGRQDGVASTAS